MLKTYQMVIMGFSSNPMISKVKIIPEKPSIMRHDNLAIAVTAVLCLTSAATCLSYIIDIIMIIIIVLERW